MIDNIDKILTNSEKLDTIADKADELLEQSSTFKSKSGTLKNTVLMNNFCLVFVLIGIVIVRYLLFRECFFIVID